MLIELKNKETLIFDDFEFQCSIGKNGTKVNKIEGDKSTPTGIFSLKEVYYRADRIKNIKTKLNLKKIYPNMGWCDDPLSNSYNSLITIKKNIPHEKMFRRDSKYDIVIVLDYNLKKPIPYKGSAIFIHITKNYKTTNGCISLSEKDLLILLRLISKKTKIKIN
tara:strand:- start:677 stop:1168 length:492 start_codon:yes stop_codon:yes gene_type:complete